MKTSYNSETLQNCYNQVLMLHAEAKQLEYEYQEELMHIPENYRVSAENLLHYLALRKRDLRDLQKELGKLGLSSLGRSESHVIASLEGVLEALQHMAAGTLEPDYETNRPFRYNAGNKILNCHADQLLGISPRERRTRIMVTLPSNAAHDEEVIKELILAGMNIARINCAHDKEEDWMNMIKHIRSSEMSTGKSCLILMDLAGPKLRTGEIEPEPPFLHLRPERDERGRVLKPSILKIIPEGKNVQSNADTAVTIKKNVFEELKIGDELKFKDIPGRKRTFRIFFTDDNYVLAECKKSAYLENWMSFRVIRNGKKKMFSFFSGIRLQTMAIRINKGDRLVLKSGDTLGTPARKDKTGKIIEPASIPCDVPQIYSQVKPGESILFDDGKIVGIVENVSCDSMLIKINRTGNKGAKLTADKGINFPESNLDISPLTDYDLKCLPFILKYADIVGFSFVKQAGDIELLHQLMEKQKSRTVGLILKIETRAAFENLPNLLLSGLKQPPLGVMVARGDLGIEMGFERMAEVQEEILWLCEAAHVPVIWATQVLEQLNKKGMPSRSEVTDAAMSARAECVMLNKGTYMVNSVQFLQNILIRMQDHQQKKTSTLRRLKVSEKI